MQWSSQLPRLRSRFGDAASDFERLAMIRFPLILLIVFFHNDRGGDFTARLQGSPAFAGIIQLVAYGFGGIRVPTFFLISGYIFFRSVSPTRPWFEKKIGARTRSLLVPLMLWNVLGIVTLGIAQQMPFLAGFINGKSAWGVPVGDFTAMQYFDAIFGTPHDQPLIYPLWFLRDLFILVLFTPLIYWAIKASNGWITLVVMLGWVFNVSPYWVAGDALFFFFVGCHLAIAGRSLFTFDGFGLVAAAGWFILQTVDLFNPLWLQTYKLKSVLGVVAVLYLSGWLTQWPVFSKVMARATRYSFFIFVAHEPLITIVRKGYFKVIAPNTALQLLLAYFAIVFVVVMILVVVFKFTERKFPLALFYLTGGRSTERGFSG